MQVLGVSSIPLDTQKHSTRLLKNWLNYPVL